MTVFGDRVFQEVIKVKSSQKGRTLIQYDTCSYRTKVMGRHIKTAAVCRPGGEASPEPNREGALILDFRPPGV